VSLGGDTTTAVAQFLAQFSTTSRAEALHLALQALRARVEPDRVLACELAWEVHQRGCWSQLRRRDGSAYRARPRPRALDSAPDTRRRATVREWAIIRLAVIVRARFRCQACGRRGRLDVDHLIKRSQGGSDFDLDRLVALCRPCHELTDAPYRDGRLVITPRGAGTFECTRIWAASKWEGAAMRMPAVHRAKSLLDA